MFDYKRIFRALRTRIRYYTKGLYHPDYYPQEIRKKYKIIDLQNKIKPNNLIYWDFLGSSESDDEKTILEFDFAGTKLNLSQIRGFWYTPALSQNLEHETSQALHRFHWMIAYLANGVTPKQVQIFFEMVGEWIQINTRAPSKVAWEPYTVSERICNWITLWQLGEQVISTNETFASFWIEELTNHLYFLARNLEYPASGLVNNHILNNARALYIGGQFIQHVGLCDLGRSIIKKHLPQMVGSGGYLLEASSHYQLLLTRTILEIKKVAIALDDPQLSDLLAEKSASMLSASKRLISPNLEELIDFPKIGDVSPDVASDWFDPRGNRTNTSWQSLWGSVPKHEFEFNCDIEGWLAIQEASWYMLTYTHPDNIANYPVGHGHDDFGSPTLFYEGEPVLVDIGRVSYEKNKEGNVSGHEASAHNTVLFDDADILLDKNSLFSVQKNIERLVKYGHDHEKRWVNWVVKMNEVDIWERSLNIDLMRTININDKLFSKSSKRAYGLLNLAPKLKLLQGKDGNFSFKGERYFYTINIQGADTVEINNTPFYPNYGVRSQTSCLNWTVELGSGEKEIHIKIIPFVKNGF